MADESEVSDEKVYFLGEGITRRDFLKGLAGAAISSLTFELSNYTERISAHEEVDYLLGEAENHFDVRYQSEEMEKALKYYHKAEEISEGEKKLEPEDKSKLREVYNRLSQLYFEKPLPSLLEDQEDSTKNREEMKNFKKGENYGIESLELNFSFKSSYNGENYREAVKKLNEKNTGKEDFPALLFYAQNSGASVMEDYQGDIGKIGGVFKFLNKLSQYSSLMDDIRDSISSYKKIRELNRDTMGGYALSSLGSLYSNLNSMPYTGFLFPDSSMEEAKDLFEESIEIDPTFLSNKILYASEFSTRINSKKGEVLFNSLLEDVLRNKDNQEIKDNYPLWNRLAIFLGEYMKERGYKKTKQERESLWKRVF